MKFMNTKRFASTALAGVMALSMATPAFAASSNAANTTDITGTYKAITLSVTVPKTGEAIINPYGLPVNLDEETTVSGQQITTGAPLVIKNQSKVALAVSAKVTGTEKGNFKFTATDVDGTKNEGNVLFEAFKAPGVLDDTDTAELNAMFAALDSADAALTATVATAEAETTGDGLVLREGDEDGATQDGGAAFVRLSGTVAKAPTTAWTANDGFTAKVVFSFEPAEYVGTVTLTAPGEVAVDATADVTVTLPTGVKANPKTVKWTSSKEANITVADKSSTATAVAGIVTGVKSVTSKVDITVEFVGTDGITYRGTTQIKCVAG